MHTHGGWTGANTCEGGAFLIVERFRLRFGFGRDFIYPRVGIIGGFVCLSRSIVLMRNHPVCAYGKAFQLDGFII